MRVGDSLLGIWRWRRARSTSLEAALRSVSLRGVDSRIVRREAFQRTAITAAECRNVSILMQLMRHAEIAATMNFYAGRDAEAVADVLWAETVNNPFNSDQNQRSHESSRVAATSNRE